MEGMLGMGFAFVEVGSVCLKPQPGNPKPRVFRLFDEKAIINRYGFNSDGVLAVAERLDQFRERQKRVIETAVRAFVHLVHSDHRTSSSHCRLTEQAVCGGRRTVQRREDSRRESWESTLARTRTA
jgi:dihydroorotate dehydrogenase